MAKPDKKQETVLAVAVTKVSDLSYQAFELTIQDGKVISKRALGRQAPDVAEIMIGRADDILWSTREQTDEALANVKAVK